MHPDQPIEPFGGMIAREVADSTPWWPEPTLPSAGSPNVIIALLDDTGFAHLGCFGSPIDTPNFDRLAARGLRYRNFHTTALCSPSRACLLTGRNHHAVGMRAVSNFDMMLAVVDFLVAQELAAQTAEAAPEAATETAAAE